MGIILIYLLSAVSSIAFGQEFTQELQLGVPPDCMDIQQVDMTWPWFGKVMSAFIAGMATLRGVAEVLLHVAPKSKNVKLVLAAAKVIGAFGIGAPKGPKCKKAKG